MSKFCKWALQIPLVKECEFEALKNMKDFENDKSDNDFAFFKSLNGTALLLIHGDKDGSVQYHHEDITIEGLVNKLIPMLKMKHVNIIYTISCYGGYQPEVTINGITIKSLHCIKSKIQCTLKNNNLYVLFDKSGSFDGVQLPDENMHIIRVNRR